MLELVSVIYSVLYHVCRCSFESIHCARLCSLLHEVLEVIQSVVACSFMDRLNPILITCMGGSLQYNTNFNVAVSKESEIENT